MKTHIEPTQAHHQRGPRRIKRNVGVFVAICVAILASSCHVERLYLSMEKAMFSGSNIPKDIRVLPLK